ncbi:MAG: hypothetical protein SGJ10_07855 [Bacteroidota bacterium]|nr:hypothetical protein [Bacteroidota bacterium]
MHKIYTKTLLSICLVWITYSASSQNIVVFQQTQQQNVLVNYNYVQMTRNDITRQLLQNLSTDIPKNIYNTEYTVNFNYDLRLVQVSSTLYNITLNRKSSTVNGDVAIGPFRLDEVMIPDLFTFEIQVVLPGGFVRWQQHYQDVQPNIDGLVLNLNNYDTLYLGGSILRIQNLQLGYTPQALNNFSKRLSLIKSYRTSIPQYFVNRLKQLPWGNIDSLAIVRQVFDQASLYQREMDPSSLQQLGADPEGKTQSFAELQRLLGEYQQQMNTMNADAPALYYKKGIDQMAVGNMEGAQKSFNLCLGSNRMSHPTAFFQLAKIDYLQGRIDTSWEKLAMVHERVPNTLQVEMLRLANDIFNTYISQAKVDISKKLYKEAIEKVSKARNPCFTLNFTGCNDTADRYNKLAWQGIYNKQVVDANAAMKMSNYILAEEKAQDAKRTARNNPKEIPDTKKADEILGKLKQSEYDGLVATGKADMNNADKVEQALYELQAAQTLQEKYTLKQNAELPKLLKAVRKTVSVKKLTALKSSMATLSMTEARKQYDIISLDIISAGLENDAEIKKLSAELSGKLGKKECDDARTDVDNKVKEAKELEKVLNFTDATNNYNIAIGIARKEKHCKIDSAEMVTSKTRIAAAVKYEALLAEAQKDLKEGAYFKVIEDLDQAAAYHKTQQLENLNIPFTDKIDWAVKNHDAAFHYYLADYYYKKSQIDNAFQMLKSSLSLGVDYRVTKDMQNKLGKDMANKDHQTRGNTPNVWVAHYISEGERELKYFKKAYEKGWKALEKAKKKKK